MKAAGNEPRSAALEILKRTRQGIPLNVALSDATSKLSSRDRRLTHEIAGGVLRHRRLIDEEVRRVLTRPKAKLPARIFDILRIGAYQLFYLDKVPPYAAVSSAVDLARVAGGTKAAGLTNAVLRTLDRDGPSVDLDNCPVSVRYSHPDWLVERWLENFGWERTEKLLAFNNTKPSLIVQAARWDEETLARAFREADVKFHASLTHHGLVVQDGVVETLPGYADGAFIIQDPAQRALLEFAAIPENITVWDACAAPGGKTMTLACGRAVVASDPSHQRVKVLLENRMRVAPSIHIALADATSAPFRDECFDAVLVDAPCSGTGTVARHPDARWLLTPERIQRATKLQAAILARTAATVRSGGLLVYLTCSIEPEENEEQINEFLEYHPEFERTREDLSIFPPDYRTDGGFGARLRRTA